MPTFSLHDAPCSAHGRGHRTGDAKRRRRRVEPTDELEQLNLPRTRPELHAALERWVEEYNSRYQQAHERRPDGRYSSAEVLGVLRETRLLPEDLDQTFFAGRFGLEEHDGVVASDHYGVFADLELTDPF